MVSSLKIKHLYKQEWFSANPSSRYERKIFQHVQKNTPPNGASAERQTFVLRSVMQLLAVKALLRSNGNHESSPTQVIISEQAMM